MKVLTAIILSAFITCSCIAAEPESRLQFKTHGFSISPLEGVSGNTPHQAFIMFLPATEAFSPNVNVQIQPYDGTLKEYAALSQQQFKTIGFTVLSEKTTKTAVVWEYKGTLQERKLHWYAKAQRARGKVYLVTATATDSQWKAVSAKLKACVDSFKIEDVEEQK